MRPRPIPILLITIGLVGSVVASAVIAEEAVLTEEEVTYPSGAVTLAAALVLPQGEGPFPAVVILQGSGDSDRSNLWARAWAEGLAQRGIAALLTDKRGCGRSDGDWRTVGFDALADDAIAGVELLRRWPAIDGARIGLLGLSQGGHVAPLAGTKSDQVAFVVDVSGAATTLIEQVDHEMRNTFREAGLDDDGVAAGMRLQALAESYVREGDWESYANALKQAADTPLAPVAADFPQTRDSWVWEWWRRLISYDPIDSWGRLQIPGLALYGRDDEQDNVPVAESVRRLESVSPGHDLTVRVFEGSGHALWAADADPHHPVVRADALDLVTDWILTRTR